MPRLNTVASMAIREMGGSLHEVAKAARAAAVRRMWKELMQAGGDEYILAHTNNVFILDAQDVRPLRRDHDDLKDAGATGRGKHLIAYVDESIVAAELNARRELVKYQFFERYGEEIDTFKIIISRGQYKRHHPFVEETPEVGDAVPSVPLDADERAVVDRQLSAIDDPRLRRVVERAMVDDLEWKKGMATHT